MKTIEITVDPQGKTTVETKGFAGSECLKASHDLEKALGLRLQERKTTEFYSAGTNVDQLGSISNEAKPSG